MAITHLKGAYYDSDTQSICTLNDVGTYEELSLGGGVTIYTGDDDITGNRVVGLGAYSLSLGDLKISEPDALTIELKASDNGSDSHGTDFNIIAGDTSAAGRGGNVNINPGDGSDGAGRVRILNPVNGFFAVLETSEISADHSFTFPDTNGRLVVGGLNDQKQIPYVDVDGEGITTNEDFTWDEDSIILGIGALNGDATLKSRHAASNAVTDYNGINLIILAEDGGSTSGNGGAVNITAGNGVAGDGDGGDVNITTGSKNGSGAVGILVINGSPTFTGTLADAITGNKNVVNGLIIN